jgi:hypothetical protein
MRVVTVIREYPICGAAIAQPPIKNVGCRGQHDIVAHTLRKRIEASAAAEDVKHAPRGLLVAAMLEGPEIVFPHYCDSLV